MRILAVGTILGMVERDASHGGTAAEVERWIGKHSGELVDDLAMLVDTETPSTDPVLLAAGVHVLTAQVRRRWPTATVRTLADGAVTAFDLAGSQPGTVVLLGHVDTVFDRGTVARRPFTVTDGVARGPGVFDMKAGLVLGVHAVAALDALGAPRPSVRLLVSVDEEIGSGRSAEVLTDESRDASAVLVLEPGMTAGTVKTARKGVGFWTVTATGVAAHAGLDPDAGASAVHALATMTSYLVSLADPALGTTLNVGVIAGGTRPNVVAASAHLELDVRVAAPAEADRIAAAITSWAPPDPRVTLDLVGGWNRPPWSADPQLVDRARAVAAALDLAFDPREVGGGSDANLVAAAGVPILDGLGASGGGAHAEHEHVVVDELPSRAALLAGIIAG